MRSERWSLQILERLQDSDKQPRFYSKYSKKSWEGGKRGVKT
jgi:hypothetical protein